MPVTLEIDDRKADKKIFEKVFSYFQYVDEKFSPFKSTSEVSLINSGRISKNKYSNDMKEILLLADQTKKEADGYFDIVTGEGTINPSGIVKGWAIRNAAQILLKENFKTFYVDAGGDIEAYGKFWKVGIRNPFNRRENVKVVYIKDRGIATSGTYIRGDHIYNPRDDHKPANGIASLTVIGPDVYEADRFATAAFAMGHNGINFIEKLRGFEGYMIDKVGLATMTSGFERYTSDANPRIHANAAKGRLHHSHVSSHCSHRY